MKTQSDIGLIGLAVMGQNLALNMSDHKWRVSVFNRTTSKVDAFLSSPAAGGSSLVGTHSLEELVATLKRPRRVMLMVRAGSGVDGIIDALLPLLEPGDIIIDGGNSHFTDSERRCSALKEKGILFLGVGISGGEEGARHGPSIMPGGNKEAWEIMKPLFQSIAAKSDEGDPCCDWVGEGGAGHYVKIVHNGIEYGDMQIICEAYHCLSGLLHLDSRKLSALFEEWNRGLLDSYLIEITKEIFLAKDRDGKPLLDKILDVAGQKGTGRWTAISALDAGVPLTLIGEAVFARCLSAQKEEREELSRAYPPTEEPYGGSHSELQEDMGCALYASKIMSYVQGFMLMRNAAEQYGWKLDFGAIALMWRGGCIIRSRFLKDIEKAFRKNPDLTTLLLDDFFKEQIEQVEQSWRRAVMSAIKHGIPVPCFSSALTFFDGYRSKRLPANLLQAQRDYFGAHTYERVDQPRGSFFHYDWAHTHVEHPISK